MIIIVHIYNWYHSITTSIHLCTRTQIICIICTWHIPLALLSPLAGPFAPLTPLSDPLHLLGTLLAVIGSVHLGLRLLVN
jgi:hypothetical protein